MTLPVHVGFSPSCVFANIFLDASSVAFAYISSGIGGHACGLLLFQAFVLVVMVWGTGGVALMVQEQRTYESVSKNQELFLGVLW
jgi:hypothetical protein